MNNESVQTNVSETVDTVTNPTAVSYTPVVEKTPTTKPLTQKEAIYNFVIEALGTNLNPDVSLKNQVVGPVRRQVRAKLFHAIQTGVVGSRKNRTDEQLRNHCSTIISHWLRTDSRYTS